MKLSKVLLRDDCRIPEIGMTLLTEEHYDLDFEAGLVTIGRKKNPDEAPFIVPLPCIKVMRPAAKVAKK